MDALKSYSRHTILATMTADNQDALIPKILSGRIFRKIAAKGVARRFCFSEPTKGLSHIIPIFDMTRPGVAHATGSGASSEAEATASLGKVKIDLTNSTATIGMSTELDEDGENFAERITESLTIAMAIEEDRCIFTGDGTIEDNLCVGITNALLASSLVTSAATAVSDITQSEWVSVVEKLPEYQSVTPRWYMSRSLYANSSLKYPDLSQIPARMPDDADGMFAGHPVQFVPSMARQATAVAGDVVALFGHLEIGAALAYQRKIAAVECTSLFSTDDLMFRARQKTGFKCWDTGVADESGEPGSIIGLQLGSE